MTEIDAFLTAYRPNFICVPCLAAATERADEEVSNTVMMFLGERRLEAEIRECSKCSTLKLVVRRRPVG